MNAVCPFLISYIHILYCIVCNKVKSHVYLIIEPTCNLSHNNNESFVELRNVPAKLTETESLKVAELQLVKFKRDQILVVYLADIMQFNLLYDILLETV